MTRKHLQNTRTHSHTTQKEHPFTWPCIDSHIGRGAMPMRCMTSCCRSLMCSWLHSILGVGCCCKGNSLPVPSAPAAAAPRRLPLGG